MYSEQILKISCIILVIVLLLNYKKINIFLKKDSLKTNNNRNNNTNNNIDTNYNSNNYRNNNKNNNIENFEINKEINSSRVVYEYDNQNKGEFPGSIYEESINEQLNDNPVLKCNLIPILTSEECKINNIPIPKYKFPVSLMKMPNGSTISVFNDGRMYEKNMLTDSMWNGPIKNSLPLRKIPLRMITISPNGRILYGVGYDNRIYKKPENELNVINLESEWQLVEGLENIIFMMFKFEENKNYSRIIFIDTNGQIKITNTNKFNSGSQNYGIITKPVLKLIKTHDDYMMAITNEFKLELFEDREWDNSEFSSKYGAGPNKVLDVVYDYDELLFGIVILPSLNMVEIMKQENSFPTEPFIPLDMNRFKDYKINKLLTDKEIIKSKIGVIPSENILEDDSLDNDVNIAYHKQLLRDKERLRQFCLSKGLGRQNNYKNYDILKQIDENNEKIESLNKAIVNLITNDPNKKKIQESIEGINFINQQKNIKNAEAIIKDDN